MKKSRSLVKASSGSSSSCAVVDCWSYHLCFIRRWRRFFNESDSPFVLSFRRPKGGRRVVEDFVRKISCTSTLCPRDSSLHSTTRQILCCYVLQNQCIMSFLLPLYLVGIQSASKLIQNPKEILYQCVILSIAKDLITSTFMFPRFLRVCIPFFWPCFPHLAFASPSASEGKSYINK